MENNIPQSAWEMVAPNIAQDDRTTNIQDFYTLQNQEQGKEDITDTGVMTTPEIQQIHYVLQLQLFILYSIL